eukprot:PhM_4_TR3081/c1_g3_i1/m.53921
MSRLQRLHNDSVPFKCSKTPSQQLPGSQVQHTPTKVLNFESDDQDETVFLSEHRAVQQKIAQAFLFSGVSIKSLRAVLKCMERPLTSEYAYNPPESMYSALRKGSERHCAQVL